ncbi:PQQ-binding-like beta-propeller repeat protein [Paraflavitalea sp. CAU 1676]|uniref:outer membrane protein assembly factor BamB family protein n=1 Tax=Paraflavitalea sp. CAU 1676 TaxID=3032598 RepID=UPI0023DA4F52|nr:PQQ-binding-like beta-propeller repeat protein [Paraflavitalea sp. CAU 1676]MDF2192060.1 PQQ-binding-like beta-propeller repeat protein [Paraflavitalea sp. CAU 1676]
METKYINRNLPTTIFICAVCLWTACNEAPTKEYVSWSAYGGSAENIHYSSLRQIDTSNVSQLEPAWAYRTGDADTVHFSQIQCNPIIVNGILYGTTPTTKLFAVDAATGQHKWTFDPADSTQQNNGARFILNNNRGVTYWQGGDDARILYTAGSFVYAVNAATGKLVDSFGTHGRVDLHDGLGRDVGDRFVTATSPGIIYNDLFILGSRVDEGSAAAPGHIRAYDVHSGKIKWIFHTIPQPGEYGYDTWDDPNAYQHIGGANSWGGFALDKERGILFAPTGSASFDFYGGKRLGANLFANCLLALDAATGQRKWHFQFVHHDVWDRDVPCAPALVTVKKEGASVDAVAQVTKQGMVYIFDRETGQPVYPIEEKAIDTSLALRGDKIWPTQPIVSRPAPFVRQRFTDNDLNPYLPDSSRAKLKKDLAGYRYGNMYMPPNTQTMVLLPGLDGGAEWGGPSYDPETGMLYVNANEMPWLITMRENKTGPPKAENYGQAGKRLYDRHCMSCHGGDRKGAGNYPSLLGVATRYKEPDLLSLINSGRRMMPAFGHLNTEEKAAIMSFITEQKLQQSRSFKLQPSKADSFLNLPYSMTGYYKFLSPEGYPAISPPWGTLTAINLHTGDHVWKTTLGEYAELKAKGVPATGTENYGGSVVTAGGLLFIAAARDGKLRAFNKFSGKLLWEYDLPAPGFATPSVYEVNGRQFIVIACGGGKLRTTSGDTYMAFALPPQSK